MKGAEATAVAMLLAKTGKDILEIRDYINQHYYTWISHWMKSEIPIGLMKAAKEQSHKHSKPFFESTDFEDAIS